MHRLSEGITHRAWYRLLPAAWLAFAVGCGGLEAGAEASEAPSTEARVPQEMGPITPSAPGAVPPAEAAPAAQARPWFHRVGGPQDDLGTGLAVDGSGHVSLVWLSTPRQDADRAPVEGEQLALSLARYDSEGQRLWTREFPRNRVDAPRVVASPGGDLFLSGNAFLYDIDFGLGAASDGFLVKFSPEGEPLWQRRAGQKVYATVADASGGVFVAAEEWTPDGLLPVLAHHDAQGAFVWTRQLDVVQRGTELRAAARRSSGQWLLAGRLEGVLTVDGQRFGAPGEPSLLLLAFGGDGRLSWGKAWQGVDAHVSGLKLDPAGGGARGRLLRRPDVGGLPAVRSRRLRPLHGGRGQGALGPRASLWAGSGGSCGSGGGAGRGGLGGGRVWRHPEPVFARGRAAQRAGVDARCVLRGELPGGGHRAGIRPGPWPRPRGPAAPWRRGEWGPGGLPSSSRSVREAWEQGVHPAHPLWGMAGIRAGEANGNT
ncbi:hypothetical protein ACN28S_51625 [Cystobacter fuscus]